MFRKSSLLAVALGLTAIVSAAAPAAAKPSPHLGSVNTHISAQFRPAPASTTMQPSQQASHWRDPNRSSFECVPRRLCNEYGCHWRC